MLASTIEITDLHSVPLFAGLPDDVLDLIQARSRPIDLRPHETLFRQADPSDMAYIVLAGRLRLIQHTLDGRDVTLDVFAPGELIALTSALTVEVEAHIGACEAVNAARVIAFPAALVYDAMSLSPTLMRRVIALLLNRLRDAQDHVRELASEAAERRIARAVLRLAEKSGVPEGASIRLDMPVTRQSLAEMSGTTLHTASRTLSAWHRAKWVFAGRETLTLLVPHAIQTIAEGREPSLR